MENTSPRPNEEVDLTQFFKWLGRGFTRLGENSIALMAATRNLFFSNRIFFATIIIAGLILGGIYSELLKQKYYKTTMVLSCAYLNTQIVKNTIEKLNLLCYDADRAGLSRELGISDTLAKEVLGFEYASFISENDVVEMEVLKEQLYNVAEEKRDLVDKVIKKLELENKDAFQISALILNPNISKPLEQALVRYFRNSEYIKKRVEINSKMLEQRRSKLTAESFKLDSLKNVLYLNLQAAARNGHGSNNVILNDETGNQPLDIYKEDLLINKELLAIEHDLYVKPDFELVDGFTTFNQPESASLWRILGIAFLISVSTGYLILLAWKFDRMLANYPTKI
jgi:hypothetical protein